MTDTDKLMHRIDQLKGAGLQPITTATVCVYRLPDGPVVTRIEETPRRMHGWMLNEALLTHGLGTLRCCAACERRRRADDRRAVMIGIAGAVGVVVMIALWLAGVTP
tara:strand:+ start:1318 stop:1638 length:321 start_codon:yes stop_codon:yes gene_type:complete